MRNTSGLSEGGLPAEAPDATPEVGISRRGIGTGQGVALYLSAVVGAGVLVLPGQTASLAGPAVLVAWAFSCLLGAERSGIGSAANLRSRFRTDLGVTPTGYRRAFSLLEKPNRS